MPRTRPDCDAPAHHPTRPGADTGHVATVASLGVQARIVHADAEHNCKVADLIAACERLRDQSERLFDRVIDLLRDDDRQGATDRSAGRPTGD